MYDPSLLQRGDTHLDMKFQVLDVSNRNEAIEGIRRKVATSGPYFGFMMLCESQSNLDNQH